jgi:hypothetical protein
LYYVAAVVVVDIYHHYIDFLHNMGASADDPVAVAVVVVDDSLIYPQNMDRILSYNPHHILYVEHVLYLHHILYASFQLWQIEGVLRVGNPHSFGNPHSSQATAGSFLPLD